MGNGQGSGCEKLISHLTEMISAVLYTFEHGKSDSKMRPKNFALVSRDPRRHQKY